jgi:beta-lactamase superfamily II metal-dependent hydrolase
MILKCFRFNPKKRKEMKKRIVLLIIAGLLMAIPQFAQAFTPSGLLEIHYINVGWGTSVLVIGPDGTRMLMDGGRDGMGPGQVIPYMTSLNLLPTDGLTYILASHLHSDHIAGLTEVMNGGYDVFGAVYYNGSNNSNNYVTNFMNAAAQTSSGPARALALGAVIQLGDSATATCVCVNGTVIGRGLIPNARDNENDRSIGVLIKYGRFEYLFAGDLGGGDDDYSCTQRNTSQVNVETPVAQAITPGGAFPLLTTDGLEVLHVNHHGSESSMNNDYMDYLTPAVACIATGSGQSPDYMFPRQDVLDNVLLSNVPCVAADAALVLQSEEGAPSGGETSFNGYCVGDIVISTNGIANFTVSANGQVTEGPDERIAAGLPRTIPLDGVPPDIVPPTVTVSVPNGGEQWIAGSQRFVTWNAFDTSGIAAYSIDYSTNSGTNWILVQAQTNGNPGTYAWNVPQTPSTTCLAKVTVWDAANNTSNDISNNVFSIVVSQDSIAPTVTVLAPNGGETWYSDDIDTIRWTASDDIGVASYSISYTTNNGGSWNTIQARTTGNPMIYPWHVPNIVSTNCKIRVLVWDDVQHLASDLSNSAFSILYQDNQGPSVDVILPDGGEIWTAGSSRYVFWSATDTSGIDSVSLQYSMDAGTNWGNIMPYTHQNMGFYLWNIPVDIRSRQMLVRARCMDTAGNIGDGISSAVFTIRKSPVEDQKVRALPAAR